LSNLAASSTFSGASSTSTSISESSSSSVFFACQV
jgi:hypothetical protein